MVEPTRSSRWKLKLTNWIPTDKRRSSRQITRVTRSTLKIKAMIPMRYSAIA